MNDWQQVVKKKKKIGHAPIEMISLYFGCLLTKPDHFHTQCSCSECIFSEENKEEYLFYTAVPLSERSPEEIIWPGIDKLIVNITSTFDNCVSDVHHYQGEFKIN
jgi:hypothetical protein